MMGLIVEQTHKIQNLEAMLQQKKLQKEARKA